MICCQSPGHWDSQLGASGHELQGAGCWVDQGGAGFHHMRGTRESWGWWKAGRGVTWREMTASTLCFFRSREKNEWMLAEGRVVSVGLFGQRDFSW